MNVLPDLYRQFLAGADSSAETADRFARRTVAQYDMADGTDDLDAAVRFVIEAVTR